MENNFWKYYCNLESDFLNTLRYVELSISNYNTYSIEYVKIILSVCSEVDVLSKVVCERLGHKVKTMDRYVGIFNHHFEFMHTYHLIINNNIRLIPWASIKTNESPEWWKKHNKIKHDRSVNFENANLGNCFNALSGLYVLNLYYSMLTYNQPPISFSEIFGKQNQPRTLINALYDYRIPQDFKLPLTSAQ